jgi:hypothetical protein
VTTDGSRGFARRNYTAHADFTVCRPGPSSVSCTYLPSLISIEETLLIPPVIVLLTCSVLMEMDCTLMSVANLFVSTWATSTAREMALPRAFTVT